PADPGTRALAREILAHPEGLPLVCLRGHVGAQVLAGDQPFPDPAGLPPTPHHSLTRLSRSAGGPLPALGIGSLAGPPTAPRPRPVWRTFCAHWHLCRGTPTRFWLEHELALVFGVGESPSADSADRLYDEISAKLAEPGFRPR